MKLDFFFKTFLLLSCLLFMSDQVQAASPEFTLPIACEVGTDFVLSDMDAMRAGVDVLASASGVVRGVRNDMRVSMSVRSVLPRSRAANAETVWCWPMKMAGRPSIATCAGAASS